MQKVNVFLAKNLALLLNEHPVPVFGIYRNLLLTHASIRLSLNETFYLS